MAKKGKSGRGKMRADRVTGRTLLQTALLLVLPVVIGRITGMETAAVLFVPVASVVTVWLFSEVMWERSVFRGVRMLMRSDRREEADICRHRLAVFGFAAGLVIGIGVTFLQPFMFGPEASQIGRQWVTLLLVPGLCFLGAAGGERGFLRGRGAHVELAIIFALQTILLLALPILLAFLFGRHGRKVDALLMTDCYRYVYGAAGAMAGISIAMLIVWIVLFVARLRYRFVSLLGSRSARGRRDHSYVCAEGLPILILFALTVFDLFTWFHSSMPSGSEESVSGILLFGKYAGAVLAPSVFAGVILCLPFILPIYQIIGGFQRDDEASALDKFATMVRHAMILDLPVAFLSCALAKLLITLLCGKPDDLMLILFRLQVLIVPILGFSILLCTLFVKFGGIRAVFICGAVGVGIHVLLTILLTVAGRGLYAFVFGHLLGFLVFAVMIFLFLSLSLTYRQEWMHGFVIPLISAVFACVPAFALAGVLAGLFGELLTVMLLAALSVFLYVIILTALHGVTEYELYHVPGGRILVGISRLFGRGL